MGRGEGELLDFRLRSFTDQDCAFAFAEIMAVKNKEKNTYTHT
jgi:hypothetical protein